MTRPVTEHGPTSSSTNTVVFSRNARGQEVSRTLSLLDQPVTLARHGTAWHAQVG
jgi:hypothetical protein